MVLNVIVLLVATTALIKTVDIFISSSSKIARHINISEYTIGFLLIAVATSLPELMVGITSAIQKNPILSYGTVIGSNIALMTIVLAIPVFISGAMSTRTILKTKDIYYSIIFSVLPMVLILDKTLSRVDGLILLASYVLYFYIVFKKDQILESLNKKLKRPEFLKQIGVFLIALVLVLISSELIVKSASELSIKLGWSLSFIGLTVVAVGTSLPEIAYAVSAVKGRHEQEVMGNTVGSLVANSSLVLGVTALIYPITNTKIFSTIFLVFTMLIFLRFIRTKEKIDRLEAGILLLVYGLFVTLEFYLQ